MPLASENMANSFVALNSDQDVFRDINDDKKVDDESDSSDHDHSTEDEKANSTSNGNNGDSCYSKATKELKHSVKNQDRGIFWWRIVVTSIMLITAISLTCATYTQLSHSEQNEFQNEFDIFSRTIIDEVNFEFHLLTQSLEAFSNSVTSYGLTSSQIPGKTWWPYVTIPQHELTAHGESVVSLSSQNFLWITPIVDDIAKWDDYLSIVENETDAPSIPHVFAVKGSDTVPLNGTGRFTPIHQLFCADCSIGSRASYTSMLNYDLSSDPGVRKAVSSTTATNVSVLSGLISFSLLRDTFPETFDSNEPISMFVEPIKGTFNSSDIVGYIHSLVEWKYFFSVSNIHWASEWVAISIVNTCGDALFFKVTKNRKDYIDLDEFNKIRMSDYYESANLALEDYSIIGLEAAKAAGVCIYTMTIHPTLDYRKQFNSNSGIYTSIVGITMIVMVGSFLFYDHYVRHRNEIVLKSAVQSSAIVSSMFPTNVRDRLYKEQEMNEKNRKQRGNLKAFLHNGNGLDGTMDEESDTKPLADLFPETTVMFADIAGFTAWSSIREPSQVFVLLESLYAAFDAIAKRNRIFKVETIGDCYVAVSGLPEPRKDHAIAMCKFTFAILKTMHKMTKQMETTLGPDTGDLALRIGLHSGPVTAGVLRGDRARFQLFGDTMNTAARMEQTGMKNKIQLSQATADSVIAEGKSHWLRVREDKVVAKGKGELTTYWLNMKTGRSGRQSNHSSDTNSVNYTDSDADLSHDQTNFDTNVLSSKMERLVDWNVDILCRLLMEIMSDRNEQVGEDTLDSDHYSIDLVAPTQSTAFDEVKEIIPIPQERKAKVHTITSKITISSDVSDQLRKYIYQIALLYKNNHFHNFEHASHVTMSVSKLLSRIVAPSDTNDDGCDHTYGITSDPLVQFACIFSALVHDVDHAGVTNAQLSTENVALAERYGGKSIAEQNSIDIAWNLLLQDEYKDFRCAICATKSELVRFRQLLVNIVMATDIMDKELKQIRETRWTKAFSDPMDTTSLTKEEELDEVNRKATVVIEHLIQASDVSHTMQHWHIYRKWNDRFFWECYDAYEKGRSLVNPLDTWYEGELGFFDYYIIPLARKLEECGVFGVSSAEYLQYAINNRSEWESRGRTIVAELKENVAARKNIHSGV